MADSRATTPSSDSHEAALLPSTALTINDQEYFSKLVADCEISLRKSGRNHVSTQMAGVQVLLGVMGIMAAIVYLDPAKQCAYGQCDDAWLASIIHSEEVRKYIYFLSGFIGYGSTNCTFAYYGPQELKELLANLKGTSKKILACGSVVTFIVLQGIQIILTARKTGTTGFSLTLSTVGAVAGAIYGASGITKKLERLPHLLKDTAKYIYTHCKSKTNAERLAQARLAFYEQERTTFNAMISAKWKSIVARSSRIEIDSDQDPIEFLLSENTEPQLPSFFARATHKAVQACGTVFATALSSTFVNLVKLSLEDTVENKPGLAICTAGLTASATYGNFALVNGAFERAYEVIKSKLNGQPIDSILFQLRPIQTSAIVASSALFSIFSYAFVDLGWQMMWPSAQENKWDISLQSAGRAIARSGMDVFHFMGPADVFTQLLFQHVLKNGTPTEKFFAKLELTVDYLKSRLQQTDFIKKIESEFNTHERQLLNLQTWSSFLAKLEKLPHDEALIILTEKKLTQFADDILKPQRITQSLGLS